MAGRAKMTHETLIIGGGPTGYVLARAFESERDVLLLDDDSRAIERARERGIPARTVALDKSAALIRAIPERVETVIVASRTDSRNLLVGQHARLSRGPARVVALVNHPHNRTAFGDASITPVCASTALATALDSECRVDVGGTGPTAGTATSHGDATSRETRPDGRGEDSN